MIRTKASQIVQIFFVIFGNGSGLFLRCQVQSMSTLYFAIHLLPGPWDGRHPAPEGIAAKRRKRRKKHGFLRLLRLFAAIRVVFNPADSSVYAKFITPALVTANWDLMNQILNHEE
jgi:hypothetical protein